MGSFLFDLRWVVRSLLRRPVTAAAAVVCLALGIGVHLAALGLADALLERPPAGVVDADRLHRLHARFEVPTWGEITSSSHALTAGDALAAADSFDGVVAWFTTEMALGPPAEATPIEAAVVTPGYFSLLRAPLLSGRAFVADDGEIGAPPVVVVSERLWRRQLGADPALVDGDGTIVVSGIPHRVVGVAAAPFAGLDLEGVDLWLPPSAGDRFYEPEWRDNPGWKVSRLVARRAEGVSPDAAAAEATAIYRSVYADGPPYMTESTLLLGPVQASAAPAGEEPARHVRVIGWMVPASALVLALAALNVAHLLLVGLIDRRRDLAVRVALGAGRGRLVRGVVLEAVLLAAAGGAFGLLLATWGRRAAAVLLLPEGVVLPGSLFDLRGLTLAGGVTVGAALLAAVVPLLAGRWNRLTATMAVGAAGVGLGRSRVTEGLLALQVAATLLVAAGAGLFAQSLGQVRAADSGMDLDRVLVAQIGGGGAELEPAVAAALFDDARARVAALPGVAAAGLALGLPLEEVFGTGVTVPGLEEIPQPGGGGPYWNAFSPEAFDALGLRLEAGRPFAASDRAGTEPVAAVNATAARLLWPGEQAVGRCLHLTDEALEDGTPGPCRRVVGVVADVRRTSLGESPALQVFLPLAQSTPMDRRQLFVRATAGTDPEALDALTAELREILAEASARHAPAAAPPRVRPMIRLLDRELRPYRIGASLLGVFSLLALGLAVLGLVGATLHTLARRRRELAVRLALGAAPGDLVSLLVRRGLLPGLVGLVLGLGATLAAGRLVESLLYGVSPGDPKVLAGTATVLAVAVALATLVPALRARRVDPARALQED
jgi:predicted permease